MLVVGALAAGLWAFVFEPSSLVVREYDLYVPSWPGRAGGLRIAVLADLHVGSPFNGLEKLERIIQETNGAEPDVVLLAGDYVIQGVRGGSFVSPRDFAPVLAKLRAQLGVWAVLGNHDWWLDGPAVRAALEQDGIRVLDNQAAELDSATDLWLAGVGDYWEGKPDVSLALAEVPERRDGHRVHPQPRCLSQRFRNHVALSIAGHTHGGQVNLPLIGRPIVPSQFGERYAAGHVVEDGRHFFVSTGLGTSILPVRFRVPPEISVLRRVSSE